MPHSRKKRSVSGTEKPFSSTPENMEGAKENVQDTDLLQTMFTQLFTSMNGLHAKLDKAMDNIKSVEEEIQKPETGLQDRLSQNVCQAEDNTSDISQLKDDVKVLRRQVQLLTAMMEKKDKEISSLKEEVSDLKGRSMRDNIIVSGLPEEKDEDLEGKVKDVLKSIGIDVQHGNTGPVSFDRIHRFGSVSAGGKIPRPIVARIHDFKDKVTIMAAAPKLKDKKIKYNEEEIKIFIKDQFTDEVRNKRNDGLAQIWENKKQEEGKQAKMQLKHDKLYVNNELQRPAVSRPSIIETTSEDTEELNKLDKIKLVFTERLGERGNSFTGIGVKVSSIQDVRRALKKVLRMPDFAKASHVMSAHVLGMGPSVKTGHWDDGEWGGGASILKTIKEESVTNLAVFVARHHVANDYKLGPMRFRLIQDVTKQAVGKLAD